MFVSPQVPAVPASNDPRADVAFHLFDLRMGGAQRNTVTIANGLAQRGWRVHLVLTRAAGPLLGQVSPLVRVIGLRDGGRGRAGSTAAGRVLHEARAIPALTRYLRAHRPHIMVAAANHVHFTTVLAHRWSGGNARLVIRLTNTVTRSLDPARADARPLYAALGRRLLPDADLVITVSDAVAHEARAALRLPAARVQRIYEPALEDRFKNHLAQPVDHAWFAPGQAPVIVSAGRLVEHKDFATLLDAFALVAARGDARLVVFGDGPLKQALRRRAARLGIAGRVEIAGFTDRLPAYLARARLFVLSSRWEGLSTVLVEALAAGCPVVSTDCPHGQRELLDGGRWGRLAPVGSPEALAAAMLAELDTTRPREQLRARAEAFRAEAVVETYERVLGALTGRPGPRTQPANDRTSSGLAAA